MKHRDENFKNYALSLITSQSLLFIVCAPIHSTQTEWKSENNKMNFQQKRRIFHLHLSISFIQSQNIINNKFEAQQSLYDIFVHVLIFIIINNDYSLLSIPILGMNFIILYAPIRLPKIEFFIMKYSLGK